MKFLPSRTYTLGPVTVSVSTSETVVIFRGKSEVHVKTFRRNGHSLKKRHVSLVVGSIALVLAVFFMVPSGKTDQLDEDDLEKNKILLSDQTDFTTPAENEKLLIRKHRVKKGETLSHIAKEYGVSTATICGSSNLRSYDLIREGQVLTIPNRDGILYTMKKGNSLTGISKKYRVSLKKIVAQNDLRNPDFFLFLMQNPRTLSWDGCGPQEPVELPAGMDGAEIPLTGRAVSFMRAWILVPGTSGFDQPATAR